jgi:hydrogenase expression/formation protein HypE
MSGELDILAKIERVRRHTPTRLKDKHITLSHGSGGKAMHDLLEAVFLRAFDNPLLAAREDQAVFAPGDVSRLAFTTDSYVVKPLFFPGGDIGKLAVHGTVNDLAVSGAEPLYLSAGFILEEGLEVAVLERVVASMREAAEAAGVRIVTGDTKVVERGKADGIYINTAGVGVFRREVTLSAANARPGDVVLVNGPIGDHGTAVLIARGDLELESDLESDTAPLHGLVAALLDAAPDGVRALRDATRGGVATVLVEMALHSDTGILLDEPAIPVRPAVRGACEILGLDPLYVANEGRLVAVVAPEAADAALTAFRSHPLGRDAAIIGEVREEPAGMVFLRTVSGGTRVVDMLAGEQLPRIC